MADLIGQDVFKNVVRQLEVNDPAYPTTWNPIHQDLINNDVHLDGRITDAETEITGGRGTKLTLGENVADINTRLTTFETSYGNIDGANVRLDGVSKASQYLHEYLPFRGYIEAAYSDYTIADTINKAVISGIANDDSLDIADTTGIYVGRTYILSDGVNTEQVTVMQIVSAQRIRLTAVLLNTYGNTATLRRSSATVDYTAHSIAGDGIYYTEQLTLSGAGRLIVLQALGSTAPTADMSTANPEAFINLGAGTSTDKATYKETVFQFEVMGNTNTVFKLTIPAGAAIDTVVVVEDGTGAISPEGVQINALYGDPLAKPTQSDINGVPVVVFAIDKDQYASHALLWKSSLDISVELGYFTSVDNAGDIKVRISYAVNGGALTNLDEVITPGVGTGFRKTTLTVKIPGAALPAGENLLAIKVGRLGTDVADTHTGTMQLATLRLI
ncbi:hypothetical protein JCM15765_02740 [Paradesulfitobacterium aromaticivorans]